MPPAIQFSRQTSGHILSPLKGKVLESNSETGWNGVDNNGSNKSDDDGYSQYSGQGGYENIYGYGQDKNDRQPEWETSIQPPASSAVEIVHFTSVSSFPTQGSFSSVSSPIIISAWTTSSFDPPSLTSTLFTSPPNSPNSEATSSISAFNLVPSTSLPSPSVIYPSPTPYDYGGVVGGTPSSPSPSPSPPSSQSDIQRPMPSGIIVAIILSSLFIIVLSLVVYVVTRPKFGSLARLWKKPKAVGYRYPPRIASIASFEPKEYLDRQNDIYVPEDPSRPMSRSLLLPDSQIVSSPREDHSGETTPRSPPAVFKAPQNDYTRRSRVVSWRSSGSASVSVTSRSPRRKPRSMNRIMSILEGYPFQHEISSSEGITSRSESPNWSSTDHDHDARPLPFSVPETVE